MRHRKLRLIPITVLLLALALTVAALAQGPDATTYLIQLVPVSVTQRFQIASLRPDVLLESEGVVTAIATGEQLDHLRVLGMDPRVLDYGNLQGCYYLLPADDSGAEVARECALAIYPQDTGHLLARVGPQGEELLWQQATSLKRLFGALPLLSEIDSAPGSVCLSHEVVQEMVNKVSQSDLSEHVRNLQDDDSEPGWDALRSRFSFSSELDIEKQYIYQHFSDLGLQVEYDPFSLYGYGGSVEIFNVVATLQGTDAASDQVCVVCAHYDSIATRTPGWDWETDPAPGADDNATGTAAVMEAARVLSQYEFAHTIRFITFAGKNKDYGEASTMPKLRGKRAMISLGLSILIWWVTIPSAIRLTSWAILPRNGSWTPSARMWTSMA